MPFPPPGPPPSRSTVLPWVIAVVAVVVAVVTSVLWLANAGDASSGGDTASDVIDGGTGVPVTEAASEVVEAFLTYDHAALDASIQRVEDGITGDLAKDFAEQVDQFRRTVTENQSTSIGEVLAVAVSDPDADHGGGAYGQAVEVLVFADSNVVIDAGNRINKNRIKVVMVVEDGRWKAAKLELV